MNAICVLPGDGIGPEVVEEALKVLRRVEREFDRSFEIEFHDVGGVSITKHGTSLTSRTLDACKQADAVFLGAVGDDTYNHFPLDRRPEAALLTLRRELGCYANLRPIRSYPGLPRILGGDGGGQVDLIICRELLHGLYFGDRGVRTVNGEEEAFDTAVYPRSAVRNIARTAFELARTRRRKVTSIDKSNILATSRLWREVVIEVGEGYLDCTLEHQLVDSASMRILQSPEEYDVVVINNEYGDILSEEASLLTASHGLIPSASIGDVGTEPGPNRLPFFYEPMHGAAPDIAGLGVANPIGAMLSMALLLRLSFAYHAEAEAIENAVAAVLESGGRTRDIARPGDTVLSTSEMGDTIAEKIVR